MKQCDKGHFFDDNRFESCPYCKDETGMSRQAAVSFQNIQVPQPQSAPAQPANKFCTNCGSKALAGAKFCTGCGRPFPVTSQMPSNDIGKTVAVNQPVAAPTSDIGKTVAVTPMAVPASNDIGKTVAVSSSASVTTPSSDIGKTVAVKPIDIDALMASKAAAPVAAAPVASADPITVKPAVSASPVTEMPSAPVTVAPSATAAPAPAAPVTVAPAAPIVPAAVAPAVAAAPVASQTSKPAKTKPVAFMVCIAGGNLGDSYTVAEGRNYIAGGSDADIKLNKDPSVSVDCHSVVTYNPSNNKFTLSAGTGRGITYLNGEQIDVSAELSSGDKIKVGSSELLFVPVCTDKFKWDDKA